MKSLFVLVLLFCGAFSPAADDDIGRIIDAIGVDSVHSENEEANMRQAVLLAIDELAKARVTQLPAREGPEFDALVRQNMEANQRVRRDPAVAQAYRTTLARMLTREEIAAAAAFYGSPAGRRAHIAVIEAEKAAGAAIERLAAEPK